MLLVLSDDELEDIEGEYVVLDMQGIMVPFFWEEYRFKNQNTMIVKLKDIDTPEKATHVTVHEAYIPKEWMPETSSPNSRMLIGYTIKNHLTKESIGELIGIDDTTVNVLFEVKTVDGKSILLPAAEGLITQIDHTKQTISLILPEGIMEL